MTLHLEASSTDHGLYLTASGLYYLSELVEEHTVLARKLLTHLIYSIIAIQILLVIIDRFPILLSLLSVASHAVYLGNLRHFPIVKLSDPIFVLSCGKPQRSPGASSWIIDAIVW